MTKLISFIIPTRRLDNVRGFFDNIEKTAHDPSCVEVLIKFDDDQQGVEEFIKAEIKRRSFTIKYVITPRFEGVYSLWIGMEQLFFMTSSESYFVQVVSDEPRFITPHWDLMLRKYISFFKDDVFRLRLSSMKFANYSSHYECTFRPDSFAIYTRRWLELTEGTGDCWGSDAYQQCVAFHLSLGPGSYYNIYREGGLCRDVVVYDIELGGLEFGVGISFEEQKDRHKRNLKEWNRLTAHFMQEHFSYLARRIYCYIWAYENGITQCRLLKNINRKSIAIINNSDQVVKEVSYLVPYWIVFFQNITRRFIRLFPFVLMVFVKCYLILCNVIRIVFVQSYLKLFNATRKAMEISFNSVRKKSLRALIALCLPINFIFNSMRKICPLLRPNIFILNPKKMNVPKWIKKPTKEQIEWLKKELDCQNNLRDQLKNKIFFLKELDS